MNQGNLEPLNPDQISSELDANYGTMIDDLNQPLIFYKNRAGALANLNERFIIVSLILPFATYAYLCTYPERWWVATCFLLFIAVLYIVQRRYFAGAVQPVLEMNSTGLVLRTLHYNMAIPWNEIQEARAHRFITWHIGIVPVDAAKTAARGTFLTQCILWLHVLLIGVYRPFGVFVAPIELHASEFPISAETLAEQINLRRAHALQLAQQRDLDILPPT